MRDEKEGQTNIKAKQHGTPKGVTFPKKNELPRVGLEPTTLYTLDRVFYQLSYQGSTAGLEHTCTCVSVSHTQCIMVVLYLYLYFMKEGRRLATVPLLQECIARERFHVIRGKRFGPGR